MGKCRVIRESGDTGAVLVVLPGAWRHEAILAKLYVVFSLLYVYFSVGRKGSLHTSPPGAWSSLCEVCHPGA